MGGGWTRGRRRGGGGVNPDNRRIVIINSTGFDVHDTQALLGNKLGTFILPNGCSPFDACWSCGTSNHIKSTKCDCCPMMRPRGRGWTLAVAMIIGSPSGFFGLFTNPGSPCYLTLRQCPSFKVPIAEGEHAETMPGVSRTMRLRRKGKALPPTRINCRQVGSVILGCHSTVIRTKIRLLADTDSLFQVLSASTEKIVCSSIPFWSNLIIPERIGRSSISRTSTSFQGTRGHPGVQCVVRLDIHQTPDAGTVLDAHIVLTFSRRVYDID